MEQDNLDQAQRALAELTSAIASVGAMFKSYTEGLGAAESEFALPAMVETARAARRCADDLYFRLMSEALDEGVPPAVLDLPQD